MTSSRLPGLMACLAVAIAVLALAVHAGDAYYSRCTAMGDGGYLYAYSGSLLQYAMRRGIGAGLALVLKQSGDIYMLNDLTAAVLSPVLPLRHVFSVYVNGVWFLAMTAAVYALMWDRLRSPFAAALTIPFLIALPPASYPGGLYDLNVNLHGYLLGTGAIACILISDGGCRALPCLAAGAFLGLLAMARVFALAPVVLCLVPLLVEALVGTTREQRLRTLGGLGLVMLAGLVVSGWFLFPRIQGMLGYLKIDFGPAAQMGKAGPMEALRTWLRFVYSIFQSHPAYGPLTVVLVLAGCYNLWRARARGAGWRDLNWRYLWMAVVPIALQMLLRSVWVLYAWPAVLGWYLLVMFPVRLEGRDVADAYAHPLIRAALVVALVSAGYGFDRRLEEGQAPGGVPRAPIREQARRILADARPTGKTELTLGLSHHIYTELGSLSAVFLFDEGCVVYGMFENGLEGDAEHPRIVMRPDTVTGPIAWDPDVFKERVFTVAAMFERFNRKVDYAVILAPEAWPAKWDAYWMKYYPQWVELSKKLLESPNWKPLGTAIPVQYLETVLVLKKTGPAPAH